MMLASSLGGIDLADDALDLVAEARRLLDARAGRRAQVQLELAAVDRRERSPARATAPAARTSRRRRSRSTPAKQRAGDAGSAPAARGSRRGMRSKPRSKARWSRTRGLRRSCFRCPASCSCAAQQVLRHRRHQRAREHVGGEHREHDRFGQRHEQIARDAGEEEHRHEHDADAQRRDERRDGDLLRAVENRLLESLCLARGAG